MNHNICPSITNNNKTHSVDNNNVNDNRETDARDSRLSNLQNQLLNLDLKILANEVDAIDDESSPKRDESFESRRSRREKSTTPVHADPCTYAAGETQGDYLNRLKASRKQPRSATATTTPGVLANKEDPRSLRRSTSQPKSDTYISPFKALKQQSTILYNTRATLKKQLSENIDKSPSDLDQEQSKRRSAGFRPSDYGLVKPPKR